MFLFVLQREPRNAEALADLGYCYYLQGQLTKAESALSKAVKLESSNPRFHNNLGLVVGNQGRFDEALAHFQAAGTEADSEGGSGSVNSAFCMIEVTLPSKGRSPVSIW